MYFRNNEDDHARSVFIDVFIISNSSRDAEMGPCTARSTLPGSQSVPQTGVWHGTVRGRARGTVTVACVPTYVCAAVRGVSRSIEVNCETFAERTYARVHVCCRCCWAVLQ